MSKKISYLAYKLYNKAIAFFRLTFLRGKRYRPKTLRGKKVLSAYDGNLKLAEMIRAGKPFAAVRYGGTELSGYCAGKEYMLGLKKQLPQQIANNLQRQSGFFPNDPSLLPRFASLFEDVSGEIDFLACYASMMENYMVRFHTPKQMIVADNRSMEPYYFQGKSLWTEALRGKKVLVIHPFDQSIQAQYQKRELLFSDPNVLPPFELHTMRAVQTIVGTIDPRFNNWFEALDYMVEEALKIPFDIALIGCGAYGLPLACMLKRAGKQAIHIGGATQIIFGIIGRRWEQNSEEVRALFNEHWIRPSAEETPANKEKNEFGGAYW